MQQSRRRTGQCLALAGLHLGDAAIGQDRRGLQLDIVQLDLVLAADGLDHQGKRVYLNCFLIRSLLGDAATQRVCLVLQLSVRKRYEVPCRVAHQARHIGRRLRPGPQPWPPAVRFQA